MLATLGSVGAAAATAHTVVNARRLRTPPATPEPAAERVAVLVPVRDEAARVGPCLRSVLGQQGVPAVTVTVLDDGSTDATADVVRTVASGDDRVRLVPGDRLPPGWLGKPHACARLAAAAPADADVLVFLDADVVLAPTALAATLAVLRDSGLDLVCPYPRQLADGLGPRLVQPLLQWSWLTFLPLRVAERSPRPSLTAANGQLLAVRADAYRRSGGHGAPGVRPAVLEDLALVRAVKAAGGRGGVVDGTALATCRMYAGWPALRDGYTKSLWAAFGSPAGAAATIGLLVLLYVVPPAAALTALAAGRRRAAVVPVLGYLAGVAGRVVSARRTGGRPMPDSLAHPASVAALASLTLRSWHGRRAGTLAWKGRPVVIAEDPA